MIESPRFRRATTVLLGALLGFSLSRIGFTNYDELHKMFVFSDLRLLMVFAGAVGLSAIAYRLHPLGRAIPARGVDRSTVIGSIIFGLGWALSGACPGAALAQLGEGKLFAVFTLAGIVSGTLAYGPLNGRLLRWGTSSCG